MFGRKVGLVVLPPEGEVDGTFVTGSLDSLAIRDMDEDPVLKVGSRVVEGRGGAGRKYTRKKQRAVNE